MSAVERMVATGDRDPTNGLPARECVDGEGKLRPVEAPTVLALIPGTLPTGTSRERLSALVQASAWDVAVPFLAYALPVREAVWWGCMCVGWAAPSLSDDERRALLAAETWVRAGDEPSRRACLLAAKRVKGGAPAAVALAAHGARLGTTLSPLGNQWVATALKRALAGRHEAARAEMSRRFVASGCDIASGGAGRLPTEAVREAVAEGAGR